MKFYLDIKEKSIELDEFLDEAEMELSPFQFSLEELSQYINGSIEMIFNDEYHIHLDLFFDFSVCFEEIVESVQHIINSWSGKEHIWFCEQGSDFYLYYEIKEDVIALSFKKGQEVGNINRNTPDFTVEVNKLEYVQEWEKVFQELAKLFKEKLNKEIVLPF